MRNATILVMRLKGVATETIKNIVLAGIGKLVVYDGDTVSEEDLGAGFFFRDEDVGKKVRIRLPRQQFVPSMACLVDSHPSARRRRMGCEHGSCNKAITVAATLSPSTLCLQLHIYQDLSACFRQYPVRHMIQGTSKEIYARWQ